MTDCKPKGYPAISPYAVLDDPEASLDFIEALFGGRRMRVSRDDDGRIHHAEIRIGEAVLMMGRSSREWDATDSHLHFYMPDIDDIWHRALKLGATRVQEPMQRHDGDYRGDYRGGFRDPGGITWWIACQTAEAEADHDMKEQH